MKKMILSAILITLLLNIGSLAAAGTIKIILPNGKPAANAQLNVLVDGKYEYVFSTDETGIFLFPTNDFSTAAITLASQTGDKYLPVVLPAQIIVDSNLSLVMQSSPRH